jgi:hypothetical protein
MSCDVCGKGEGKDAMCRGSNWLWFSGYERHVIYDPLALQYSAADMKWGGWLKRIWKLSSTGMQLGSDPPSLFRRDERLVQSKPSFIGIVTGS